MLWVLLRGLFVIDSPEIERISKGPTKAGFRDNQLRFQRPIGKKFSGSSLLPLPSPEESETTSQLQEVGEKAGLVTRRGN